MRRGFDPLTEYHALVAQWIRATGFDPAGREFESLLGLHISHDQDDQTAPPKGVSQVRFLGGIPTLRGTVVGAAGCKPVAVMALVVRFHPGRRNADGCKAVRLNGI